MNWNEPKGNSDRANFTQLIYENLKKTKSQNEKFFLTVSFRINRVLVTQSDDQIEQNCLRFEFITLTKLPFDFGFVKKIKLNFSICATEISVFWWRIENKIFGKRFWIKFHEKNKLMFWIESHGYFWLRFRLFGKTYLRMAFMFAPSVGKNNRRKSF